MDWKRKLDEIREKPEHIRLRYVWMMVFFSMAVIFLIWLVSLDQRWTRNSGSVSQEKKSGSFTEIQKEVNTFKEASGQFLEQQRSLTEELKKTENQGSNQEALQEPTTQNNQ